MHIDALDKYEYYSYNLFYFLIINPIAMYISASYPLHKFPHFIKKGSHLSNREKALPVYPYSSRSIAIAKIIYFFSLLEILSPLACISFNVSFMLFYFWVSFIFISRNLCYSCGLFLLYIIFRICLMFTNYCYWFRLAYVIMRTAFQNKIGSILSYNLNAALAKLNDYSYFLNFKSYSAWLINFLIFPGWLLKKGKAIYMKIVVLNQTKNAFFSRNNGPIFPSPSANVIIFISIISRKSQTNRVLPRC